MDFTIILPKYISPVPVIMLPGFMEKYNEEAVIKFNPVPPLSATVSISYPLCISFLSATALIFSVMELYQVVSGPFN